MGLDLNLRNLPKPHFNSALFQGPLITLQEISKRNLTRFEQGSETRQFKNRKEELIKRLQRRREKGESFDRATDVLGRERLLLTIYLEYLGRDDAKNWLPEFDIPIARSLLRGNGENWHLGRRRQVTLLFFMHFDRLDALSFVCDRLIEAYSSAEAGETEPVRTWQEKRRLIFDAAGPENIAGQARDGEELSKLMERFCVPKKGRFSEKLYQEVLLREIKTARLGKELESFTEIERLKEERVFGNQLMGAAALKILVQRVASEGDRKWTGQWSEWITRFGCDPRYGRATAESAKWWGWATDSELRLAQQGVTGLTLKFFIDFLKSSLKGTEKESQFSLRSRFLMALFEGQKIQNARLVLNSSAYSQLPHQYRDPWNVALLLGTTEQTSMVCLRCTDDIYIIEGTHSFGLRIFYKKFPIDEFWENPQKTYPDKKLRISPADCPVFLIHSPKGKWVRDFFQKLRTTFHVEWYDVSLRLP